MPVVCYTGIMTNKLPPLNNTYKLIGQVTWAALNELKTLSGKEASPVKFSDLKSHMIENLSRYPFADWDFALKLVKSGQPKWLYYLGWAGTLLTKLDYKVSKSGYWETTPDGDAFLKKHQTKQAKAKAETWLGSQYPVYFPPRPRKTKSPAEEADTLSLEVPTQKSFDEDEASNQISAHIENLGWRKFQDLVGYLFEGMGYTISYASTSGPDDGIDLIAHRDPLGAEGAILKIQVKHTESKKKAKSVPIGEIQRLNGICQSDNSLGIFVTSKEFSSKAASQVKLGATPNVTLIDYSRFVKLWIQHLETIPEEGKAMLPLKQVYVLDNEEVPEVPEDDGDPETPS